MEPENTAPAGNGNKKKFLVITLVVILVVAGIALGYLFMQKVTPVRGPEALVITEKKVFTQEEKLKLLAELASSTPKDTPAQTAEKLRTLQELAKKTPVDTPEQTAEKLRTLQALASSTKQ